MNTNQNDIRQYGDIPELRNPVLIAGFAGWSDAGDIATYALETLIGAWSATRFADIDPENYFDFSETRPTVSLDSGGQRDLEWPSNTFYAHQLPDAERDVVLLLGSEPHLRWRTFCELILTVANDVNASRLITLGGLLADVPHTRKPTFTGFVSSTKFLPQLQDLGVYLSSYEGPTGIIGALHDAWRSTKRPAVSLWGNVPHYISATPNPQVASALLQRVSTLLGMALPISTLEEHALDFSLRVDEALKENPEAMEYVRQLEEDQAEEERHSERHSPAAPVDTPMLIQALEEFLRTKRPTEESDSE